MRKILNFLRRIITAPFRLITWPFRKFRDFINFEPEDTSTPDVFAQTIKEPMVLLEHLDVLRKHLFRSLAALAVTTGISFAFASQILDFLAQPIGGINELQSIEVTESLGAFMRVSLLSGVTLALPYLLLEAFAFINPALKKRERITILIALPFAAIMFVGGLAFAYFIMLPAALPFLLNFLDITTIPRPSNYVRFVTNLMFWIGVSFQFPLVIYALAAVGFVKAKTLISGWRFAIIGIAVLAAMVTPTVDPVNMALVMAPMSVLYLLSIGMAVIAGRGRAKHEAAQTLSVNST
jgi:sec-independent protein translocase protein TatC